MLCGRRFLCHAATYFVATYSTPKIAERGGWTAVCLSYGAVTAAVGVLWSSLVSNRRPQKTEQEGWATKKKAVEWGIFKNKSALSVMLCQVADNNMTDVSAATDRGLPHLATRSSDAGRCCQQGIFLWAPTYFTTVLGCRPLAVPAYLAVPQLIQTFGGFPAAAVEALLLHRGFDKLRLRRLATGLGSVVEALAAVAYIRAATAARAAVWLCVQQVGMLGHRAGFEQSYLEVGGPDAAILTSVGNCAANGAGMWTPPLSVLLRHLSGGSWLPHIFVAGAVKLLTALFYAANVTLTPARDATAAA